MNTVTNINTPTSAAKFSIRDLCEVNQNGNLFHTAFLGRRTKGETTVDQLWLITSLGVSRADRPEVIGNASGCEFTVQEFVSIQITIVKEKQ